MFGPSPTLVLVQALLLLAGFAPSFWLCLVPKIGKRMKSPQGVPHSGRCPLGDTPGCVWPRWRCSSAQLVQPVTHCMALSLLKTEWGRGGGGCWRPDVPSLLGRFSTQAFQESCFHGRAPGPDGCPPKQGGAQHWEGGAIDTYAANAPPVCSVLMGCPRSSLHKWALSELLLLTPAPPRHPVLAEGPRGQVSCPKPPASCRLGAAGVLGGGRSCIRPLMGFGGPNQPQLGPQPASAGTPTHRGSI